MLKDFVEFVENVCSNWSGDRTAALILGLIFGALAVLFAGRYLRFFVSPWTYRQHEKERLRLEAENQRLREENKEAGGKSDTLWKMRKEWEDERERIQEKNRQLSEECERHKDELVIVGANLDKKRNTGKLLYLEYVKLRDQNSALNGQVQHIMDLEGKFWEKTPVNPPAFRPFDEKSAPIIAVMNLKGGVGKTTLTANLGARLGSEGFRVLYVDLDHQATLTSLCLSDAQERDANTGDGKLINNVIKAKGRFDQVAWQNIVPVAHSSTSCLLATNKALAHIEEDSKARWLLQKTECDPRFVLRQALHAPMIQQRFDVVLIDCPPRITTGCINALACADFVLVPVILDKPSIDAVPNLLGWLRMLREKGICPSLALLGIVGNRSHYKGRLTAREKTVWARLKELSSESWGEPVYHFDNAIPSKPAFAEVAQNRSLAALDDELGPVFGKLVDELLSRKVIHESRRIAVVRS